MKIWHRMVGDNDGHTYIIPADKDGEWYAFLDLPEDDERSWDVPVWAVRLTSSSLRFAEWEEA